MSGNAFVRGGTKSVGSRPVIAAVQPGVQMHDGSSGASSTVAGVPGAVIQRVDATSSAADTGRQATDAGAPQNTGGGRRSTQSSFTNIGRTSNCCRKLNGIQRRSSITTSPVIGVREGGGRRCPGGGYGG